MAEQNTCGGCQYYDQHKEGMFFKNEHNMLMAHGEVRILDNTKACGNFEPCLPKNNNARLLFLAAKHPDDILIQYLVKSITENQHKLRDHITRSHDKLDRLTNVNELNPGFAFSGFISDYFIPFREIEPLYEVISSAYFDLTNKLEDLGEDVSFF